VTLLQDACPGLVGRVEAGDWDGPATRTILNRAIQPMLDRGVDALVLGCTHYPFVRPLIEEIAGPGVEVIDPAPAVARQVERSLPPAHGGETAPTVPFLTTGPLEPFLALLPRLLNGCCGSQPRAAHLDWDEIQAARLSLTPGAHPQVT
jgi:glutamate racemase